MAIKTAASEERKALREEYQNVTGKEAFRGWNADELRSRITVHQKANAFQAQQPGPKTGEDHVEVLMMADGVFLPLEEWDEETKRGVVPDEWRNVPGPIDSLDGMSDNEKMTLTKQLDTRPVPRRARLMVPASCAKFLSDREQAEILS